MAIFEEYEQSFSVGVFARPNVNVVIYNDTPHGWGAVIIEVGATFKFQNTQGQDDGLDIVQMDNLNQADGDPPITITSRSNKCCRDVFVAIKVKIPGNEPQLIGAWSGDPAKPDECKLSCSFRLAPKTNVSMGNIGTYLSLAPV